MNEAQIGIIGGTGLGEILLQEAGCQAVEVDTPYGPPSSTPLLADWGGTTVAFLSRHGPGHQYNPTCVPYRANIWALKKLGVTAILASGATGSLREEIEPAHLVICDQVIDKTTQRKSTFFDDGPVTHIEFAEPFCPTMRAMLLNAGEAVSTTVHPKGTYVCMEGPQFSSRAESFMHRLWGGDLIGMTCMPEAKLAREAEICYGLVALPTDYDCWRPTSETAGADELLKEILGNLKRATDHAVTLLRETVGRMKGVVPSCKCQNALKMAIWSDKTKISKEIRQRLEPLLSSHLAD